MKKHCPYCGNTSGKEDTYGNCISCGGNLVLDYSTNPVAEAYRFGLMSPAEIRREYSGISGSYLFSESGQEIFVSGSKYRSIYDFPEIQEREKMARMASLISNSDYLSYPTKEAYYGIDGDIVLRWRNVGGEGVPPRWFIDKPFP